MVQRFMTDRGVCRPNAVSSKAITDTSNDDANQPRRASVTEDAPETIPTHIKRLLMYHCTEVIYRLKSGGVFRATETHPEPVQICVDDPSIRRRPCSSVDASEDSDLADTVPESGLARGVPRAGLHNGAAKRRRKGRGSPLPALPKKRRSAKQRRAQKETDHDSDSDSDSEDEDELVDLEGAEMELIQLRIDQVKPWYEKVFRSIKQKACKDIVKAWIRYCHPRKQTLNPYNGGKDRKRTERSRKKYGYDGHYSRPRYWPSDKGWRKPNVVGARHREPDHIHRDERLIVMIHILYIDDKGFEDGKHGKFNLTRLKESTAGIHLNRGKKEHGEHWSSGHVELLTEVYRVREMELEYERGWRDADSLVTVPIPPPRCKVRKASNSAVKAARPTPKQVKRKPAPAKAVTCIAPVAKMCSTPQIDDSDMDVSDGSEPIVIADTPSSTEEVTPDASCPEPTLCKTRTFHHGLPSFDSPWPEDKRYHPVQEVLTPSSSNLGPEPSICTPPNPVEYSVTPGEGQRILPLRDQYRFGPSSMQSFPRRQVGPRQNDFNSTTAQWVADPMRPRGTFTRSPPPRPMAPKVEHVRHPEFTSSSTGLAGYFRRDAGYSSRQTENPWSTQAEPSMYTATGDPDASLLPPTDCSFSSGYSEATLSGDPQLGTWNDGNQLLMQQYHQSLDEPQQHLGQQAVAFPQYQCYGMDAMPPGGHPNPANQPMCPTPFYNHTSSGTENFGPFSHDQL